MKKCLTSRSFCRLCSSYPQKLLVPIWITDKELESVASFRSWKRIPVVVYRWVCWHAGQGKAASFVCSLLMISFHLICVPGIRRMEQWLPVAASLRSAGGAGGTQTMNTWWRPSLKLVKWTLEPKRHWRTGNEEKLPTPPTVILVKLLIIFWVHSLIAARGEAGQIEFLCMISFWMFSIEPKLFSEGDG